MTPIRQLPQSGRPINGDRLLSTAQVAQLLSCCNVTAARVMRESGCLIKIRRRNFVLESKFYNYLKNKNESF